MNIITASVSGLIATLVFSMILMLAPKMGLPKMDIVELLGSMFGTKPNPVVGWLLHLMMGAMFGVIYAYLWSIGLGSASVFIGICFGAVHWLIVGLMMLVIPMVHAGIRSGSVKAPGAYMMANGGGLMAFMGGLVGHMVFGAVVALVYASL